MRLSRLLPLALAAGCPVADDANDDTDATDTDAAPDCPDIGEQARVSTAPWDGAHIASDPGAMAISPDTVSFGAEFAVGWDGGLTSARFEQQGTEVGVAPLVVATVSGAGGAETCTILFELSTEAYAYAAGAGGSAAPDGLKAWVKDGGWAFGLAATPSTVTGARGDCQFDDADFDAVELLGGGLWIAVGGAPADDGLAYAKQVLGASDLPDNKFTGGAITWPQLDIESDLVAVLGFATDECDRVDAEAALADALARSAVNGGETLPQAYFQVITPSGLQFSAAPR